jgi:hypothetical protein
MCLCNIFPVLRLRQENVASECIRSHYVMPLGLVFFWHKRNGGGGWNVASFCIAGWQALQHRNVACGMRMTLCLMRGGLQKCVPEKTNRRAGEGKAKKRPRSPRTLGRGFFLPEGNWRNCP